MASGANGTVIDDFGGDNFDHSKLGFIGGQYIGAIMTGGRPIEFHRRRPARRAGASIGSARWRGITTTPVTIQRHGVHGLSRRYLDLDPTYKDAWGQPLLRITFDFPDNDVRMSQYVADKAAEIARAMGAKTVVRGGASGL